MSHVLIASDGSECSKAAQEFVASLPFREKPNVKLVAATPLPVTLSEYYVESVLFEQARHTQNTVIAPRTTAEAERLRPQFASVTTDLRIGDPANEILDAADESKADVIVLGARGLSAIPRFLLGSVSDYVCRHAHQSILIVRAPHASGGRKAELHLPPRRILFATDGSDAANQAIDRFASWKWPAGSEAKVVIAHQVVTAFGMEIAAVDEPYRTAERLKAEAILQSASQRLSKVFSSVETEINNSSQIAHTIVEEAEKWNADLIVIGNRGLSRWERFLLGSTSLGVLHHAPCSVWVEKHR